MLPHNESASENQNPHQPKWHWPKAAFLVLSVVGISTLAAWYLQKPVYSATATLRLSRENDPLKKVLQGPDSFDVFKRTQRQLLRSRFVLTPALRDSTLANVPVLQDKPDPLLWLEENLSVTFPGDSDVMQVSLSAGEPERLHELVNAIVQAYFDEFVFSEGNQKRNRLKALELVYAKVGTDVSAKTVEIQGPEIAHLQAIQNHIGAEIQQTKVEIQRELTTQVAPFSEAQPARIANVRSRLTKTAAAGIVSLFFAIAFLAARVLTFRQGPLGLGADLLSGRWPNLRLIVAGALMALLPAIIEASISRAILLIFPPLSAARDTFFSHYAAAQQSRSWDWISSIIATAGVVIMAYSLRCAWRQRSQRTS